MLLAVKTLNASAAFFTGIGQTLRWGTGEISFLFCWQAMLLALSVLNVSGAFCTEIGQTQTKVEKFHLLRRLKVHYVV